MGRAKDWMMEQEERGWWSVPDKFVCAECFDDDDLKQVTRENAEAAICDYCGTTSGEITGDENDAIAAPFDSVMEVIAEGIHAEFNDADNECIPYETAEGGYQANTLDTYDIVTDNVPTTNDAIFREVLESFRDRVWVERHYWSLSRYQSLRYSWQDFCKIVKHENRYFFQLRKRTEPADSPTSADSKPNGHNPLAPPELDEEDQHKPPGGSDEDILRFGIPFKRETDIPNDTDLTDAELKEALAEAQEGVSASRMLQELGEVIKEGGLLRELPSATMFFRARVGPTSKPFKTARKLGPPPPRKAQASRMSPAGVPMFYGASDEVTAVAETVPGRLKRGEVISVGVFSTLESFVVLDFTNLQPVPGLFSPQRDLRPVLFFLHSFVQDLSKSIKKDHRVHIEYVPTQIVTEYFRRAFQSDDGRLVRGILYPSARAKGGVSSVLFFTREECGAPERGLFKDRCKQWLRFVRGSAKTLKHKPLRRRKGTQSKRSSP